jgi:flagellin
LLQTADGAMIEQVNMMQRMRELSIQAASDTVTPDQKSYLNSEYQSLLTEIDRVATATQWNGKNLLDGTGGKAGDGTYVFQVGANTATSVTDQSVSVSLGRSAVAAGTAGTTTGIYADLIGTAISDGAGLSTTVKASEATSKLDLAIKAGNEKRALIGAGINRLNYAADNLSNISMNTAASRSRIEDTDYAQASTELARTQIIQQAATAMLAQANQSPQSVLALLK